MCCKGYVLSLYRDGSGGRWFFGVMNIPNPPFGAPPNLKKKGGNDAGMQVNARCFSSNSSLVPLFEIFYPPLL